MICNIKQLSSNAFIKQFLITSEDEEYVILKAFALRTDNSIEMRKKIISIEIILRKYLDSYLLQSVKKVNKNGKYSVTKLPKVTFYTISNSYEELKALQDKITGGF